MLYKFLISNRAELIGRCRQKVAKRFEHSEVPQKTAISAEEFRTLNGCLDEAIAAAVSFFGSARQIHVDNQTETLRNRLKQFATEHRRLVELAEHSFDAMQSGNVGLNGATGNLHRYALDELKSLAERTLPVIHLVSEATTVTSR